MQTTGRVIKTDGDMAIVAVERATACGEACANCSGNCKMAKNFVEVKNTMNVKTGQFVVIETETKSVLLSAFLVYILPIIFLCAGYLAAEAMGYGEGTSMISGFVLFILTFVCLHFYDKKRKNKVISNIKEIIK